MARTYSKAKVLIGVTLGGIIAGLPLLNKKVYQREQEVALMRDQHYGGDLGKGKDAARNSRLQRTT
jgi:hypothetical protein